jgi:hypothetical protein
MHHIGYINILLVQYMVDTVHSSFGNFAVDKLVGTFGGVAPGAALTPQKRGPHPWLTWRWGRLPVGTA